MNKRYLRQKFRVIDAASIHGIVIVAIMLLLAQPVSQASRVIYPTQAAAAN